MLEEGKMEKWNREMYGLLHLCHITLQGKPVTKFNGKDVRGNFDNSSLR